MYYFVTSDLTKNAFLLFYFFIANTYKFLHFEMHNRGTFKNNSFAIIGQIAPTSDQANSWLLNCVASVRDQLQLAFSVAILVFV